MKEKNFLFIDIKKERFFVYLIVVLKEFQMYKSLRM